MKRPTGYPGLCCMSTACGDLDCPGHALAQMYAAEGLQQIDTSQECSVRRPHIQPIRRRLFTTRSREARGRVVALGGCGLLFIALSLIFNR